MIEIQQRFHNEFENLDQILTNLEKVNVNLQKESRNAQEMFREKYNDMEQNMLSIMNSSRELKKGVTELKSKFTIQNVRSNHIKKRYVNSVSKCQKNAFIFQNIIMMIANSTNYNDYHGSLIIISRRILM